MSFHTSFLLAWGKSGISLEKWLADFFVVSETEKVQNMRESRQ